MTQYREKWWSELNDGEKIERMREIIKSLRSNIHYLSRKMDELFEHAHLDGKLIIPLSWYSGREEVLGVEGPKGEQEKDNVYF